MRLYRYSVDDRGHQRRGTGGTATLSTSTEPARVHRDVDGQGEPTGDIVLTDWTYNGEIRNPDGTYGAGVRYNVVLTPDEIRRVYELLCKTENPTP